MTALRTAKCLLAGLGLAALLASPLRAEAPGALRLSYKVWTGGFNSLGIEAILRRTKTAYRIGLEGRTRGVVGWFWPYALSLEATGDLGGPGGGAGVTPRRFRQVHDDDGRQGRREIRYGAKGGLELSLDGEPADLDNGALSGAAVQGSLDPASALLALVESLARSGRCTDSLPVFDGKRRYDLTLAEQRRVTLGPSRYALYSGPATRCRMTVEAHAGFREGGRFPRILEVWLAPAAEGAPAVPVRIVGRNALASMFIHLTAVRTADAAEEARR